MAVTISNTTTSTGVISGATVSNGGIGSLSGYYSDGYDMNRDTIYGVPSRDWQRMSYDQQRYYADRWRQDQIYYEQRAKNKCLREMMDQEVLEKTPPLMPSWKHDTKLLLLEK